MCLTVDKNLSKDWLKQHKNPEEYIRFEKELLIYGLPTKEANKFKLGFVSPTYRSFVWEPGILKSSFNARIRKGIFRKEICEGIHCYSSKENKFRAPKITSSQIKLLTVPIYAKPKHFLGMEHHRNRGYHFAFSKVLFTNEAYHGAFKRISNLYKYYKLNVYFEWIYS